MTDQQIYHALRKQFRAIDENIDALRDRCTTDAQRQQLADDWAQAQKNYIEAGNRLFDGAEEDVKRLYEKLGEAQGEIDESMAEIRKIDQVLDKIARAVRIGKRLVKLGA